MVTKYSRKFYNLSTSNSDSYQPGDVFEFVEGLHSRILINVRGFRATTGEVSHARFEIVEGMEDSVSYSGSSTASIISTGALNITLEDVMHSGELSVMVQGYAADTHWLMEVERWDTTL